MKPQPTIIEQAMDLWHQRLQQTKNKHSLNNLNTDADINNDDCFDNTDEPCFLGLFEFQNDIDRANLLNAVQIFIDNNNSNNHNINNINNNLLLNIIKLSEVNLFNSMAQLLLNSTCHIYLNLDLLTIDPYSQDYGDFKIKPNQVEVQRDELTREALFIERTGLIIRLKKSGLTALNQALSASNNTYTMIGKTWGQTTAGAAQLDVYRDAKLQMTIVADNLR